MLQLLYSWVPQAHLCHPGPHLLGPLLAHEADPRVERREEAGHVAADDSEDADSPHLLKVGGVLLLQQGRHSMVADVEHKRVPPTCSPVSRPRVLCLDDNPYSDKGLGVATTNLPVWKCCHGNIIPEVCMASQPIQPCMYTALEVFLLPHI